MLYAHHDYVTREKYTTMFKSTIATMTMLVLAADATNLRSFATTQSEQQQRHHIRRLLDVQACYNNLHVSDENNDNFLSQSEFVSFVNLTSHGELTLHPEWGVEITTFYLLPRELVDVYSYFTCGVGVNYGCPTVIGIDISDAESMIKETSVMIIKLCKDTQDRVNELLGYVEIEVVGETTNNTGDVTFVESSGMGESAVADGADDTSITVLPSTTAKEEFTTIVDIDAAETATNSVVVASSSDSTIPSAEEENVAHVGSRLQYGLMMCAISLVLATIAFILSRRRTVLKERKDLMKLKGADEESSVVERYGWVLCL